MDYKTIEQWLKIEENEQLLTIRNKKPTKEQAIQVFHIARFLDPKGNHNPTSCGRCYQSAIKAIKRSLNIF